jgi:tellurite resistance protein TerC
MPLPHLAFAEGSDSLRSFDTPPELWIGFAIGVVALLLLDLLVFHRDAHEVSFREAAISSTIWIALGLVFGLIVWHFLGGTAATQYYTGYLIEKSLSVDNVFVWAVIFTYLSIPSRYQHRVLFWGIFGALTLRILFVLGGVVLLERLDWLLFVFGGFLILTAIRMARHHEADPEHNPLLKLLRRVLRVTPVLHGQKLFARVDHRLWATPLFVALVLIEATDVLFAVDSVPAILAISRDPFVVISSNAMAILGLRALYFLLVGAQDRLVYLNKGLAVILAFVGAKMLLSRVYHIPALVSLVVIGVILIVTVVASLRTTARRATDSEATET